MTSRFSEALFGPLEKEKRALDLQSAPKVSLSPCPKCIFVNSLLPSGEKFQQCLSQDKQQSTPPPYDVHMVYMTTHRIRKSHGERAEEPNFKLAP